MLKICKRCRQLRLKILSAVGNKEISLYVIVHTFMHCLPPITISLIFFLVYCTVAYAERLVHAIIMLYLKSVMRTWVKNVTLYREKIWKLKVHGKEQNFPSFLHKSLLPRSLALHFEPFWFWLQILGDIHIRKTTPRIVESESHRLGVWLIRRVADSPYRWVGESFFEYKYLREFEGKIGTAWIVVYGTYAEPINAKTSENPVCFHVPLMFTLFTLLYYVWTKKIIF